MIAEGHGKSAGSHNVPASDSPPCPACAAAQAAVEQLAERVASGEDGGLAWERVCNCHAWSLTRWPMAVRRLALARLRQEADQLTARPQEPVRRRTGATAGRPGDCPFCAAMDAAALSCLIQPGGLVPGGPLCVPHLTVALRNADGREQLETITRAALRSFRALETELSELIRKSDYRFRQERRGPEATSWTRAALLIAGTPGVRWLWRSNRARDV